MLAEERICDAETAMQMPLWRFLEWLVRIEKKYADRAAAQAAARS